MLPDGRLGPLDSVPAPASWETVLWSPAVVAWCPVVKGQNLLVEVEPDSHLDQVPGLATPAAGRPANCRRGSCLMWGPERPFGWTPMCGALDACLCLPLWCQPLLIG